MSTDAIAFYSDHAEGLAERYDTLPTEAHFAPVRHLFPPAPAQVLDIGTATGRAARWFADQGHAVTGAEPVAAFFDMARNSDTRVTWVQDGLPDLPRLTAAPARFNLITLSGVWHHLAPAERACAAAAIARLLAPSGTILVSLRSGPSHPGLPVYPVAPDDTAALFAPHGLDEHARIPAPSIQQANRDAGVTWIWLALCRTGASA